MTHDPALAHALRESLPRDFATAFSGLDDHDRATLLCRIAEVIEHEAETLSNHMDLEPNPSTRDYSRYKTGQAAAELLNVVTEMLTAESVRQGGWLE